MELYWRRIDKYEYLYAGCYDTPLAYIYRSSSGKRWNVCIEMPSPTWLWLKANRWKPYDEARATATAIVKHALDLMATQRPAVDSESPAHPSHDLPFPQDVEKYLPVFEKKG